MCQDEPWGASALSMETHFRQRGQPCTEKVLFCLVEVPEHTLRSMLGADGGAPSSCMVPDRKDRAGKEPAEHI